MCSGKVFQKPSSLPPITTEPVQGLKNHTVACISCPQGLSCPGMQVMSPERLETLADPSSSKAPLKYSQCQWHTLANESGSWPPVFYLQLCFPFQVHFNWHELLKHWMPLSAFLKGKRYIKYIRLQVFKIKCYKQRLNYMLFIPLRNSRSWHSVPSFQNNFYLHLHLGVFKTQRRGNAFVDITGNRELRSASWLPANLRRQQRKHPGQLSRLRAGLCRPLRGEPEGSPAVRKGDLGTTSSQNQKPDT